MQRYEKEFNDIIDYSLSNKINEIVFQERKLGSKILMGKLGNISIYNDSYEKDQVKKIFKSIYEKYTLEKFDENTMHYKKNDINFNGIKLEYSFIQTYPYGFDVYLRFI